MFSKRRCVAATSAGLWWGKSVFTIIVVRIDLGISKQEFSPNHASTLQNGHRKPANTVSHSGKGKEQVYAGTSLPLWRFIEDAASRDSSEPVPRRPAFPASDLHCTQGMAVQTLPTKIFWSSPSQEECPIGPPGRWRPCCHRAGAWKRLRLESALEGRLRLGW